MKTSENTADLFKAFVAAQAELKNAAFDKINPHFKSKYATLAGMRDGIAPVLTKHGLAVIQGTSFDGQEAAVDTRLVHTSGQWIESRYPFQIDKPQQMGSAVTYARRYSLAAICGIASEEDDDGNAANTSPPKPATVTTIPKAEARPEYARMSEAIKIINESGTLEDLRLFYKNNIKTIESFDQGWQQQIMKEFDDAVAALKAKAA
jgi:hypothetical protein